MLVTVCQPFVQSDRVTYSAVPGISLLMSAFWMAFFTLAEYVSMSVSPRVQTAALDGLTVSSAVTSTRFSGRAADPSATGASVPSSTASTVCRAARILFSASCAPLPMENQ